MNIWKNKNWSPMLLQEINKPFNSKDYIFELKFDGQRAIVFASPKEVIIKSRNYHDITYLYPELQSIKNLVNKNVIFDGEIVVFDNDKPSFQKLQERFRLKNKNTIKTYSEKMKVEFVCFDILYEDKDLTNLDLMQRKEILSKYKDNDVFIKNKYIDEKGIDLFKKVVKLDLEGIIAKKKDSKYIINDRNYNWIKIKNLKSENFYICGYNEKKGSNVISLLLGEIKNNKYYFVGKVSMAKKRELYNKIKKLNVKKKSPFIDYNEEGNYITPKFKCKIKYLERTKSNHLRQPIFINEVK